MKNFICLLCLLCLVFASCKRDASLESGAPEGEKLLLLKLSFPGLTSIKIAHENGDVARLTATNGEFLDTIREAGRYLVSAGKKRIPLYLEPSGELIVLEDSNGQLRFEGEMDLVQNYLQSKQKQNVVWNNQEFINSPTDYAKALKERYAGLRDDLENLDHQEFKSTEKKNLEYNYLLDLLIYPSTYNYLMGKNPELPDDYYKDFDGFDYSNLELFNKNETYKNLAVTYLGHKLKEQSSKAEKVQFIASIDPLEIKEEFLMQLTSAIGGANAQEYYDLVKLSTDNPEIINQANNQLATAFEPVAGAPSPIFTLPDPDGKMHSSSDLKGKLVYIDVWATWCGPCLAQIPHLKKIEKEYEAKGLQVVSISIDEKRNEEKWRKMIKDRQLGGLQLIAESAWKSSFVQAYRISGIPRFILLDKQGKIIDPNAPRPADPRLRTLLEKYL